MTVDRSGTAGLEDEAFALLRRHHEEPGERQAQHIARWRTRSPAHEAAYQRAEAQWLLLGMVELPPATPSQRVRLAFEHACACVLDHPVPLAACILGVLVLVLSPLEPSQSAPQAVVRAAAPAQETVPSAALQYRSGPRQQEEYALEDGSVLYLNWDSEVEVRYTPDRRALRLLRGEAMFDVAADAARPFVVSAETLQAEAVGTAFVVRRIAEGQASVAVTEGVVNVGLEGMTQRVALQPAQALQLTLRGLGEVNTRSLPEIEAWRHGMLIFDGTPLEDVLAELGRYTGYSIETRFLADPDEGVNASFFIAEADDALRSLAQLFRLELDGRTPGKVVIRSAPPLRPGA
ncbi:MAG TPA: FecR domain-containing protein [Hyphomicrobiales bacterium]|nr:FecR domain-containing protein [Hyphomicrobiales bacterium]